MKKAAWIILLLVFTLVSPALADDKAKEPKDPKEGKAGSVRVYRFDNLDIEGHVKTPHLMYFLKRIKNRFRAFRLPEPQLTKKIVESKDAEFLN
jgi:hypothetical protein